MKTYKKLNNLKKKYRDTRQVDVWNIIIIEENNQASSLFNHDTFS